MNRRVLCTALILPSLTSFALASGAATPEALSVYAHERATQFLERVPNLAFNPTAILVRFESDASPGFKSNVRALIGDGSFRRVDDENGIELVSTRVRPEIAIARIAPLVRYAERDWVVRAIATPNDPNYGLLWGLNNTGQTVNGDPGIAGADVNAPQAWDTTTGDANFTIAIIDTGVQYTHPDLAANIWTNPGEIAGNGVDDDGNGYVDDVRGWDFYNVDNDPMDTGGHGTHTAGTVGAVGNNGIGVAGLNWRCKLLPMRFLGPQGGYTSDAILAVNYCRVKGVKVSNNSWGGGGYSQGMYDAINSSKSVGHVFCAAAGNAGTNNDASPFYPASYNLDNLISVASTTNDDTRSSFSNYGATSVDLGAPGSTILSTYLNNGYAYMSGTSMATPHVAGVASLVYAQNPSWTYGQVRSRLFTTARPIAGLSGLCVTGAVLDAAAAVGTGGGNTAPTVTISSPANNTTVVTGTPVTFTGSASDVQQGNLSASLVWNSNLMGQIGTGATFSRSDMSAGTHTVTASVTDAGGLGGTATVTLIVQSAGSPPATPGTPTITEPGGGQAQLTWADNSNNESNFEIQRQKRVNGVWTNTTNLGPVGANVTTFLDTPGVGRFRYRVRATNAYGASVWTAWRTVNI